MKPLAQIIALAFALTACVSCQSEPLPQQSSTYSATIQWNSTGIGATGFAVDYIDASGTNGVRIGGSPVLGGTNYSLATSLTNGSAVTVWATNSAGIPSWPNPTATFNANVPAAATTLTIH